MSSQMSGFCTNPLDDLIKIIWPFPWPKERAPSPPRPSVGELLDKNEKAHKEAMERLEARMRENEQSMKKAREEAEEEKRRMRAEEDKAVTLLLEKSENAEKAHEEKVKQMITEYTQKMEKLRGESMEMCKTARTEHRIKIDELNRKHKTETDQAEEKKEKVKKEGNKKLKEFEEHFEIMKEEGIMKLREYELEMEEITKKNQNEVKRIEENQLELQAESAKNKLNQIDIEHKQTMEYLDQFQQEYRRQIANEATKRVLKEIDAITKSVQEMTKPLKMIRAYCTIQSPKEVEGEIEVNMDEVTKWKSTFESQVFNFNQFILNENSASAEVIRVCKDYIRDLNDPMESQQMFTVLALLPPAVCKKNSKEVRFYGETVEDLTHKLNEIQYKKALKMDEAVERKIEGLRTANQLME